jgi:uncharacterized protein (DUF2267 family)
VEHDALIGQVRHRARLSSWGDAERATRATLATLGECIPEELADNLAAELPREIGWHLRRPAGYNGPADGQFDSQEFVARVAARAGVRQHLAGCLARTVFEVLGEAVKRDVMAKVAESLPDDIAELVTAGRDG